MYTVWVHYVLCGVAIASLSQLLMLGGVCVCVHS